VVVARPNYAPQQKSVRTIWDLMRDVAISARLLPKPVRPSFERNIRPIFERLAGLQWVNAGFAAAFGWGAPNDFSLREQLEKLSRNTGDTAEMRHVIANQFRVFVASAVALALWRCDEPPAARNAAAKRGVNLNAAGDAAAMVGGRFRRGL
jgi:hypothetical protein